MRKLRTMLFLFLLILCIFLNIERVDIAGQTDLVNIQSFVYVLGAIVVLSTVWLPEIWRPNEGLLVGFWLLVYVILKGVIFNTRPIIGGIHTYITITEVAFLVLILLMAYWVSKYIFDLEETIATVTLGDVSDRVKRMDQAEIDIAKELARSRRYDTPLSVLVMKVHPETTQFEIHQTAEEILQGMMKRYTSNRLIRLLDRDLRRSDLVLERPKDDQIVVLLPETSSEGTAVLANRIQSIVNLHLGLSVSYGYACFPKDAITFDDLLNRAVTRFDSPRLSHSDPGIENNE